MNGNLPFPRGDTYFGGDSSRANSSSAMQHVLGQVYRVKSKGQDSYGQDQGPLTLMTVQNLTGTTLTKLRGVKPISGATASLYTIEGTPAAGGAGFLIDDAYSGVSIINKDVFYVVLEGSVKAEGASGLKVGARKAVEFNALGQLTSGVFTSASDTLNHTVGISARTIGTGTSGSHYLFHVGPWVAPAQRP